MPEQANPDHFTAPLLPEVKLRPGHLVALQYISLEDTAMKKPATGPIFIVNQDPPLQKIYNDLLYALQLKASGTQRHFAVATFAEAQYSRLIGQLPHGSGQDVEVQSVISLSAVSQCLKRVLDTGSPRTLRHIQEDMVLLPCTYDVALVHGRVTVVLCGKLVQSSSAKEGKYMQYILRELSTMGVHHQLQSSEPASKAITQEGAHMDINTREVQVSPATLKKPRPPSQPAEPVKVEPSDKTKKSKSTQSSMLNLHPMCLNQPEDVAKVFIDLAPMYQKWSSLQLLKVICKESFPSGPVVFRNGSLEEVLQQHGTGWIPDAVKSTAGSQLQPFAAALAIATQQHQAFRGNEVRVVQEFKNKAYRKNEWGGLWYLDEIPQFGMLSTAEYRIAWWAGNYEKKANKIRGLWDKHGKANLDEITILWEKFWKHQLPVAFRASQVESDLQEVVDKAYDDIKKKIDDQKDRNVMAIQVAGVQQQSSKPTYDAEISNKQQAQVEDTQQLRGYDEDIAALADDHLYDTVIGDIPVEDSMAAWSTEAQQEHGELRILDVAGTSTAQQRHALQATTSHQSLQLPAAVQLVNVRQATIPEHPQYTINPQTCTPQQAAILPATNKGKAVIAPQLPQQYMQALDYPTARNAAPSIEQMQAFGFHHTSLPTTPITNTQKAIQHGQHLPAIVQAPQPMTLQHQVVQQSSDIPFASSTVQHLEQQQLKAAVTQIPATPAPTAWSQPSIPPHILASQQNPVVATEPQDDTAGRSRRALQVSKRAATSPEQPPSPKKQCPQGQQSRPPLPKR